MSLSNDKFQEPITVPFQQVADWHQRLWQLSSLYYESIPANKAGRFFRALHEIFEVYQPTSYMREIGIDASLRAIGHYCRILAQLEDYKKPEFDDSIRLLISTDYGREKAFRSASQIDRIAKEMGFSLSFRPEDHNVFDFKECRAFWISHAMYDVLGDVLKRHSFSKPVQKSLIDFYHSLLYFVMRSGSDDHRLVPSYVTTKLANLLNLILSYPVILTLPDRDDLEGRSYFNEGAPSFDSHAKYEDLSQDLNVAAISLEDLLDSLRSRGLMIEIAQEKIAQEIANAAQKDPDIMDKLVQWAKSMGSSAASDVVKGLVKLAIRFAGIPLP